MTITQYERGGKTTAMNDATIDGTSTSAPVPREAEEGLVHDHQPRRPDIARDLITRAQQAVGPWPVPLGRTVPRSAQDYRDEANAGYLLWVVSEHGWPGQRLVGEDGAQAAAHLALRVVDARAQLYLFQVLTAAVRLGQASRSQWAHLYDRCCALEGRHPQRYGTQHQLGADGSLIVYPIDEPQGLDVRRVQVGLPPYAEQALHLRHRFPGSARHAGPADSAQSGGEGPPPATWALIDSAKRGEAR